MKKAVMRLNQVQIAIGKVVKKRVRKKLISQSMRKARISSRRKRKQTYRIRRHPIYSSHLKIGVRAKSSPNLMRKRKVNRKYSEKNPQRWSLKKRKKKSQFKVC